MKDKYDQKYSPSDFYRKRRPEYFSDSAEIELIELPREVLSLELQNITANQKESEFETLGRKLAELLICPNLIPQVGPTGGGDGKTDTETFTVSSFILERWFIPEQGWEKGDKWAFAISAKADWKPKLQSDVEKIIGTQRGYTKIYFITNQLISSKKKKDEQDSIKSKHAIEVTILDAEWILEKVYSNKLIYVVTNCLNLSNSYRAKEKRIGSRDAERIKRLSYIENNINNPKRYFEYDYQLVEDALEAAIISRMLERPRDEIEGRFDRAERFCKKINDEKQWIRLHYQRAWTYIHWYDDVRSFLEEYKKFKTFISRDTNISGIGLYYNLFNIIRGISDSNSLSDFGIQLKDEKDNLLLILDSIETLKEMQTSSLIAKTYKIFILIFEALINGYNIELVKIYIKELTYVIEKSSHFLDYPFQTVKAVISEFGNILDILEFDNLIDKLAEASEKRSSERAAGETFIQRAIQKLDSGHYSGGIVYFGKAVMKLSKEETQTGMYFALVGMATCYTELGLCWAANTNLVASIYIALKPWFQSGKPTSRAVYALEQLLGNELFIGRIPTLLSWYELFSILYRQVSLEELDEIEPLWLLDGCLSNRLLNSEFDKINTQTKLPVILGELDLYYSRKALLYLFGYDELLKEENESEHFLEDKSLDQFFDKIANQPFKNQILYETDLVDSVKQNLSTTILGCQIHICFSSTAENIIIVEMLFSFLEGFLATCLTGLAPISEKILIELLSSQSTEIFDFEQGSSKTEYLIRANYSNFRDENIDQLWQGLLNFVAAILVNNYYTNEPISYITNLFEKEEIHERLSLILQHYKFVTGILGKDPKFLFSDWEKLSKEKNYPLKNSEKRKEVFESQRQENRKETRAGLEHVAHNKRKVISLIDIDLWDKAKWSGFGYITDPMHGLGFILCFENADPAKKIFVNWLERFGLEDTEDILRLSIIKGISKENPHWYRVQIGANLEKSKLKQGELVFALSRIHEMRPSNSINIDTAISILETEKKYKLIPCQIINNQIVPFFDSSLIKRELFVRYAWEIGKHDQDSVVIMKGDVPFIPEEKIRDAPVI
ncbi:hypothetical protein, partial [Leptospira ellisii]